MIGDFILNERLFLVTLFFCRTSSFYIVISESTLNRQKRKTVELFWAEELSLFIDLLSYNTKREERVLTNEFVTKLSRLLATR